uniref:Endonuclease/exonuclease/phosphatase domain-containing protein n=1 Tax=Tetranychus urticae TaxID=32264 RepID=T1K3D7_TETUR
MYRLGLSPQHFATGLVSIQAIWHPAGFAVINTHCPPSQAPRELFSYWITTRATITRLLSGGRDFFGNLIEPCSSMLVCGDSNFDIDRPNLRNLDETAECWFTWLLPGMAGRQREHLEIYAERMDSDFATLCGAIRDIYSQNPEYARQANIIALLNFY